MSSAVDSNVPLRKRMNILGRHPQSLSSLNSFTTVQDTSHSVSTRRNRSSDRSLSDYESASDDEEDEESSAGSGSEQPAPAPDPSPNSPKAKVKPRPRVDTTSKGINQGNWTSTSKTSPLYSASRPSPIPESPTTKAWYEFDLAVVVALVSPVGNWLTGGDHIKNLFLVVLLIFYLHQIIEIPWSLYNTARSRRRLPHLPPLPPEDHARRLAETELHNLELFFLFLTTLSPFMGALLLKYATSTVIGAHAVSWFSTGLFVLATGMRPWSHLVERLKDRTKALHDRVHYPPQPRQGEDKEVGDLRRRMEKLERKLGKIREQMKLATDDVFEYVDEAVGGVEGTVKRMEGREEVRWKNFEEVVGRIKRENLIEKERAAILWAPDRVRSLMSYILPEWLVPASKSVGHGGHHHHRHHGKRVTSPPTSPSATFHSPSSISPPSGDWSTITAGGLETIFEEGSANPKSVRVRRDYLESQESMGMVDVVVVRLCDCASGMARWAGYLLTFPVRVVGRLVFGMYA
ncbi:hypothetical protein BDQ17DRAFT_1423205 [Cyathus striatus]|nr:hypothetical protein BDQ17DRAFT_1423205 [Cyathus striatus]